MDRYRLRGALAAASFVAAVTTASMVSAATGSTNQGSVYKGPAVPLGKGTAQAWISMDENRQPASIGISMSDTALEGIEALGHASLTVPFPAEAAGTGFDHVLLDWNPHGHPPAEIWGDPHFDVHFYMIPQAVREAISEKDPDYMAKAGRDPAAQFVPADYLPPPEPEPVPGMGVHWVDVTTPELHGEPFTHTFIYGAWDGQFIFFEPMVAKGVLDERRTVVAPVKQPQAVAVPGHYPTQYRIDFDPAAAEHRIVLEGLVARERR